MFLYFRGTKGACFSTTLGSVLHELCHTFDLGHTKDGIMGRGFDNINRVFSVEGCEPLLKTFCLETRNRNSLFDDTYFTESCAAILLFHR